MPNTSRKKTSRPLISLAVTSALVILSGPALAAKGNNNFLNGKPFSILNANIEANTAAIAANQDQINNLLSQSSALSQQLADMNARITENESNIADALAQIHQNDSDISLLAAALYDLQQSVSHDLRLLNNELNDIRGNIAQLTADLSSLASTVSSTSTALSAAISQNTGEIASLTATLTVVNSDLSVAQARVTILQTAVSNTEAQLVQQQVSLATIHTALASLDNRVTTLESLHASRQFTITDTGSADDFTAGSLMDMLAEVDIQSGDYLHIYGVDGTGRYGVVELCTNDTGVIQSISDYAAGLTTFHFDDQSASDSWIRHTGNGGAWRTTEYISSRASHSGSYGSNYLNFFAYTDAVNRQYLQIQANPRDDGGPQDMELLVAAWGQGQTQTATYTLGSGRLETCGF